MVANVSICKRCLLQLSSLVFICSLTFVNSILQSQYASATAITMPGTDIPQAYDMNGKILNQIIVGHQVMITDTFHNYQNTPEFSTNIFDIRNSQGVTIAIGIIGSRIPSGGYTQASFSWVPLESDEYYLRAFMISDLSNPVALSMANQTILTVVK